MPGDRLRYDHPLGRWFNVVAGDRVAFTVTRGESTRRVEVTVPAVRELPRLLAANYVLDIVGSVGALILGLLVGWRRPDLVAYRGLAAAGITAALVFPYSVPAEAHVAWLDFAASVVANLGPGVLVFFAINYPDDKPLGWRAVMKRWYPWVFAVQVAVGIFFYARLYTGHFEPALSWFFRTLPIALPLLFFWAIYLAWQQARGEVRIRLQWILATIGTIMAVYLLGNLNRNLGFPVPAPEMDLFLSTTILAAEVGFSYAILRRRIFDFGLAVNRTLVFAIVGAILLGIFQIAHGLVGQFLQFDDRNKSILLSAILAVAVYLSFTQLKKVVEKVVDRVFFSGWAVAENDLKRFVAEAKHACDAQALSPLLVAALDRFTGGAGSAVFAHREGGTLVRTHASLAAAPEAMSANDESVLALLAHRKALRLRENTHLAPAVLALPMAYRGDLIGLALVGPRPDGDPYRADQVDALEYAVREVGLDLQALEFAKLAADVAAERRTSELLRARLETAMELAKGVQVGAAR